jgi:hypothetical protein
VSPRGVPGSRPPRPPVNYHPFVAGAPVRNAAGALRVTCAECGAYSNAWRHRSPEHVAEVQRRRVATIAERRTHPRLIPHPSTPPDEPRLQPSRISTAARAEAYRPAEPPPRQSVADWRLSMLRLAIEHALDGPELSFNLRRLLLDTQRALRSDLHGTIATELARVELRPAGPPPVTSPQALPGRPRATEGPPPSARGLAHGFRDERTRGLFLRAVAAGWRWSVTGSNHVRLEGPDGAVLTLSQTSSGHGRAYLNAKADAKRAGLDVAGL